MMGVIFGRSLIDVGRIALVVPLMVLLLETSDAKSETVLATVHRLAEYIGLSTDKAVIIPVIAGLVFASVVVDRSLQVWVVVATTRITASIRVRLVTQMFDGFMSARYEELIRRGRAGVHQDLTSGGSVSRLAALTAQSMSSLAMILFLSLLLVFLSWETTVIAAVAFIPIIVLVKRIFDRPSREISRQKYELGRTRIRAILDAIDGIRIAKVEGLGKQLTDRIRQAESSLAKVQVRSGVINSLPAAINETAGIALIIVLLALTLYAPGLGLSLPIVAAQMLAVRRVVPAAATLTSSLLQISQSYKQVSVVDEVLHNMMLEKDDGVELSSDAEIERVEARSVSFAYPGGESELVVDDVSLSMRRGQVTAIVGSTGGGKTTFADLLVRLYSPSSGEILVNGINLDDLRLSTWRSRVGYVGQDTFLFNGTLRENIVLWRDHVGIEEIEQAARDARIHEFITSLPEGYETLVGDRGLRLSGGQRQRVAIARTILHNPQVLIFDEATSALDNITEAEVQRAINSLRANAVVLVIAHRLSTVQDADQILVLESGRIVESGRHDTLINSNGAYSNLYNSELQAVVSS